MLRRGVLAAVVAAVLVSCGGPSPLPGAGPGATRAPRCSQASVIASWSLRRRAAQLLVVPVQESSLSQAAPLVRAGAGGVILFGSRAPADLAAQVHKLDSTAEGGVAPIVMTDEEGGGIQRLANLVGSLPWPRQMAKMYTPAEVRALAAGLGRAMSAVGVTMDLAPVLGIDAGPGPNARHPIGARSFGATPQVVVDYAMSFAEGLLSGGVVPVVKHFPGLGAASYNTDLGPATVPPLPQLEAGALLPFEAAVKARLPVVMVSNATIPGLTRGPASLSKAAVQGVLRRKLGFKGLVMTDSLSAGAVTATGLSVPEASVRAVRAGVQMILYDASSAAQASELGGQVVAALVAAARSGALPVRELDAAVAAVLSVKGVSLCRLGE
ncbi:MAG: glycoside hydrolase family 3 N-terminal domain-containing protein [Acidimicrobiales bacterium]